MSMKLNAIPSSIITSNINVQKHLSYPLEKSNLRKTKIILTSLPNQSSHGLKKHYLGCDVNKKMQFGYSQ